MYTNTLGSGAHTDLDLGRGGCIGSGNPSIITNDLLLPVRAYFFLFGLPVIRVNTVVFRGFTTTYFVSMSLVLELYLLLQSLHRLSIILLILLSKLKNIIELLTCSAALDSNTVSECVCSCSEVVFPSTSSGSLSNSISGSVELLLGTNESGNVE